MEEESAEFKTVKICDPSLQMAFRDLESKLLHFLNVNGFITDDVQSQVLSVKSVLSVNDKTRMLAEGIKKRVSEKYDSYHELVRGLSRGGVHYEPIVKKLNEEYQRQISTQQQDATGDSEQSDKSPAAAEKPRKANVAPDSGDLSPLTEEKPRFDADAIAKYDANITLEDPPQKGTPEYDELQKYCSQVEIILHTVNDNENLAALTYMKSPSEGRESNGVQNFPNVCMVVGVFANKKVVLIQTDPGESCEEMVKETIDCFPSAQYILAVGVCYGFDREKHLLGDVLVSKQISDFKNSKVKADGTIENRGEIKNVADFLSRVFCKRCTFNPPFKVSDTRDAKVYAGTFLSRPVLMDNKSERDKFHAAVPAAIGGEMEGGVLMKLAKQEPKKINGVIIIKGVVDYGDGTKNKEWQFTTAMAAVKYTEIKLKSVNIPPSQHTTES